MAITVFVVDDHALIRAAITNLISSQPEFEVVGDGSGSSQSLDEVRRRMPQVVVADLEMQSMRGAEFIARSKLERPQTRILVCTRLSSHAHVAEALRRGADGYVLKSSPAELLAEAIRALAAGKGYIDPALQIDVIKLVQGGSARRVAEELTAPEIEVLRLAAEGASNQRIAAQTHQSIETVKLRLRRCFQKLGASDRAHAVAIALRRKLIS